MRKVIFIATHPIQYYVPLYQKLALKKELNSIVFYCSDETVSGSFDKEFGVNVKWDIPLLENYNYKFLKNYSWKSSISKGFFGVINLGLIKELWKAEKSLIVVQGWNKSSYLMSFLFGKLFGHKVAIRGDNPLKHEASRSAFMKMLRQIVFKYLMFPRIDKFLYTGYQNKKFYEYFGVKENKLFYTPHCVDNYRFQNEYDALKTKKIKLRDELGISADVSIILYSGKYIPKKRPLDLLKAILPIENVFTIFMGDGELRENMEKLINEYRIRDRVLLTGFVNQSNISKFYTIADVFIMCSEEGETWGLSTNEAMNFELPLILYDSVGCADDLLKNGRNGILVNKGDIKKLTSSIEYYVKNKEEAILAGKESRNIIDNYNYDSIINGIELAMF